MNNIRNAILIIVSFISFHVICADHEEVNYHYADGELSSHVEAKNTLNLPYSSRSDSFTNQLASEKSALEKYMAILRDFSHNLGKSKHGTKLLPIQTDVQPLLTEQNLKHQRNIKIKKTANVRTPSGYTPLSTFNNKSEESNRLKEIFQKLGRLRPEFKNFHKIDEFLKWRKKRKGNMTRTSSNINPKDNLRSNDSHINLENTGKPFLKLRNLKDIQEILRNDSDISLFT